MAWKTAAKADTLVNGEAHAVRVNGVEIALVRMGERVHGVSNVCTHELAYLSDGFVEVGENCIECPLHQAKFDLETGRLISGPECPALRVFQVKVEGADVSVYFD